MITASIRLLQILKPQAEENDEGSLQKKNKRDADGKFPLIRLVVKQMHAGKGADAAADHSKDQQGFLLNPPFVLYGLSFIHAVGDQCSYVNYDQVDQ